MPSAALSEGFAAGIADRQFDRGCRCLTAPGELHPACLRSGLWGRRRCGKQGVPKRCLWQTNASCAGVHGCCEHARAQASSLCGCWRRVSRQAATACWKWRTTPLHVAGLHRRQHLPSAWLWQDPYDQPQRVRSNIGEGHRLKDSGLLPGHGRRHGHSREPRHLGILGRTWRWERQDCSIATSWGFWQT